MDEVIGNGGGRFLRITTAVASNAVPLVGVLVYGWSVATLLLLFWIETVLSGGSNAVRIALHRRWTGKRGHFRNHSESSPRARFRDRVGGARTGGTRAGGRTYLASYLSTFVVFTAGHGLFLVVILAAARQNLPGPAWAIDLPSLRTGALLLAASYGAELAADLPRLAGRSFAWVKQRADVALGRVLMMHLTLIFGMFVMMWWQLPTGFLAILIALKLLFDIGGTGSHELPPSPPRWIARLMASRGLDAQATWAEILREQEHEAAEDELPRQGAVPAAS